MGGSNNSGFSLAESLVVFSLLAVLFVVSVSTSMNNRRSTASNQALADLMVQQMRAVRQQAIASRIPMALCLPTSNGTQSQAQAYYIAQGVNNPRVVRMARLDSEYPSLSLFAGCWEGVVPEVGLQSFRFNGSDIALANWGEPFLKDTIFLFAPNGTIVSNSPIVSNAYHLVVCSDPVSLPISVGGQNLSKLSQATNPYTVQIAPSGSISLITGIPNGQAVSSAGLSVADRGSIALPSLRNGNANPILDPIEIAPEPLAVTLPPGVDATVDEKGYLTLTTQAEDADGDQLYVSWEVEPAGAFSSPTRLPMEWVNGHWESTWEWRPLAPLGTLYTLRCKVEDDKGGEVSRPLGANGRVLVTGDGKVIFSDGPNNDIDLYTMNADGTNLTQITEAGDYAEDYYPQVSPDGKKLLFISWGRPQGNGLYVCDIDGENVTKITPNIPAPFVNVNYACWSPDSSEIAFTPWTGTPQSDTKLFICDADGSNSTEIADLWPSRVNRTISWVWDRTLPYDPQQVQFLMNGEIGDGGEEETALVNRDTGSLVHLNDYINPALSPDGTRVAYGDPNSYNLFVADFPGFGNASMISNRGAGPTTWHPAGAKLAVFKAYSQEYCVLNADGSGERTLRGNPTYAHVATWAP